jgi:hypothetical protein
MSPENVKSLILNHKDSLTNLKRNVFTVELKGTYLHEDFSTSLPSLYLKARLVCKKTKKEIRLILDKK